MLFIPSFSSPHLSPFSVCSLSLSLSHTHTYTHVCTCTHTHTVTHTCTHTHTHTHARTHARTRTHAHAHTHTHIATFFPISQLCKIMSHLPLVLGTLVTCEFLISSFVFFLLSSSPLLWYTLTTTGMFVNHFSSPSEVPVVLDCSTFFDLLC